MSTTFSSRLPGHLAENRLTATLRRLRGGGVVLADLTESNPTDAGFDYPPALLEALATRRALEYRPHPLGLEHARAAVAGEYRRRGVDVPISRIMLTASTSEAYSFLFKLLADPGDEVLVPVPSYPLFDYLTRLDGVVPVSYPLEYHGRWTIDIDALRRAISPRARALLVASPNNPTGSYLGRDDLHAILPLCEQHELAIVSDEVFADYPLGDRIPPIGCALEQDSVLSFSLGGLSKAVGLPQLKLGWVAASGPRATVAAAMERLEIIGDSYLSVGTPVQEAAAELLAAGVTVREQILARVRSNLDRLLERAAAHPACRVLHDEGGWYGVVQVPSILSEEDLVLRLLDADHVLVHPGYFFDFPREAYLVVSLLPPARIFDPAVARVLARAEDPQQ